LKYIRFGLFTAPCAGAVILIILVANCFLGIAFVLAVPFVIFFTVLVLGFFLTTAAFFFCAFLVLPLGLNGFG
jgi:hypothetical protein